MLPQHELPTPGLGTNASSLLVGFSVFLKVWLFCYTEGLGLVWMGGNGLLLPLLSGLRCLRDNRVLRGAQVQPSPGALFAFLGASHPSVTGGSFPVLAVKGAGAVLAVGRGAGERAEQPSQASR